MERLHDEADRGLRSTASVEICVRGSRNRPPVVVGGRQRMHSLTYAIVEIGTLTHVMSGLPVRRECLWELQERQTGMSWSSYISY